MLEIKNIQRFLVVSADFLKPRFDFELAFTVFSNMLKDTQIHILADSDEQEVVQQVQVSLHLLTLLCFTEFFFCHSTWYFFILGDG